MSRFVHDSLCMVVRPAFAIVNEPICDEVVIWIIHFFMYKNIVA